MCSRKPFLVSEEIFPCVRGNLSLCPRKPFRRIRARVRGGCASRAPESVSGDQPEESVSGDRPRESVSGDQPKESVSGDQPRESILSDRTDLVKEQKMF